MTHFLASTCSIKPFPQTHDVLVSPEDPKGHLTTKYTNTAVGRYANRLPAGAVEIERGTEKATVNILPNGNLFHSI